MMNTTDIVMCILVLVYALMGWGKGFLRSLMGPLTFIVCFLLAWMYFKSTHNLIISLGISMGGPLILNGIISWFLSINEGEVGKKPLLPLSRFLGLLLSVTWGMTVTILIIVLLGIGPLKLPIAGMRESILQSQTFAFLKPHFENFLPVPPKAEKKVKVAQKQSKPTETEETAEAPTTISSTIENSQEYQDVVNDPRVKDLYGDPEVAELIKKQDYMALMQNEKFTKILEDPKLIGQMLKLKSKISHEQTTPSEE